MSDDGTHTCIVCGYSPMTWGLLGDGRSGYCVECPNCGDFAVTREAYDLLRTELDRFPNGAARPSHAIRKMQQQTGKPCIDDHDIGPLIENTPLPKPQEQADLFVLWLGRQLRGLGDSAPYMPEKTRAVVGAWDQANVGELVAALMSRELVNIDKPSHYAENWKEKVQASLTMAGWERYHDLERGVVESRKAFMAMAFSNDMLDRVYRNCFKPAVERAGFDLLRVDERPQAGLIDNRMRALIRTARFLVADLTNANLGAYWEAGFAEGLGRPVLYTCERKYFEDSRTHFDTNHCHTVLWSEDDLLQAGEDLTSTIRATLPAEAIFERE